MTASVLSYAIATVAFLALAVVLAIGWRGRATGLLFLVAALASALWSGLYVAAPLSDTIPLRLPIVGELLRDAAWLAFLWWLLRDMFGYRGRFPALLGLIAVLVIGLQLALLTMPFMLDRALAFAPTLPVAGKLAVAVIGLMLVEHVFRFTPADRRWSIKYLCLGLGGLFMFDFYLYADTLLFLRIQPEIHAARGFVNALVVPLLAVSAARNPDWSLDVYVSRRAVFHTTTLLGAGSYLVLMAAAGYYLQAFGGEWGLVLQTAFLFAALLLLAAVLFSGQLRARLRVFISKHFFNYKFDYREEWLRFTRTLSSDAAGRSLDERVVAALTGIVGSPGGRLWTREGKAFHPVVVPARLESPILQEHDSLVAYLTRSSWMIILDDYRRDPEQYDSLVLPDWLADDRRAWLVVPLLHETRLQGFAILDRPKTGLAVDWEVRDLLKTAGHQAASHLAQQEAVQALTRARQFESFNRLSAYVIHDLKNLIAQLSLVVSNARRHGHNPEFLRDAIATVDNAVARMNRLMQQLRRGDLSGRIEPIAADRVVASAVAEFAERKPPVSLAVDTDDARVLADAERLHTVLGHLIQNALDATPADGRVQVRVHDDGTDVLIDIEDTGCGMDPEFVRQRLFRPFDTTKGLSGMGIGAFESREYLRTLGGDLEVVSQPQQGARFRMRIPRTEQAVIRGAA